MEKIKVSLIIPVYNAENSVQFALESALSQTLNEIEIICINDGSTDKSGKILEKYALDNFKIRLINKENEGQSVARNIGMELARGEYIAFLDADDTLEPDALQIMYNLASENKVDISMCSICVINEKEKVKNYSDTYLSLDIFPRFLDDKIFKPEELYSFLFKIAVVPWNKLYRKDFLNENNIKFRENINFEDNIFFLDTFLRAKNINFTRKPLVNYSIMSESSYTFDTLQDYKKLDFFTVFKLEEKILKDLKIQKNILKNFQKHKKSSLIYWFEKIKNEEIKKKYYFKLLLAYPSFIFKDIICFFEKKRIIKEINEVLNSKKVYFRGFDNFLAEILSSDEIKNTQNILGIIDKNPNKIGKMCSKYSILDYSVLNKNIPDEIILSLKNVSNFEKIVEKELFELDLNIKLNSKIFKTS